MPFEPLTFLLLGEEPLVIQCAQMCLERGHLLRGIVTRSEQVQAWAQNHRVDVVDRADFPALMQSSPVDVLVSVTYPALIPAQCIAAARVAAVNYHDGPLPRYAGMNGSAWALANAEPTHAIVWHHLTEGLDEGDVIERRDLELYPRETSVSLNMRNSALAQESFATLLQRIERRDLKGTPQRTDQARTVFSRHDRPPALGQVDWAQSAEQVDAWVRACDFGPYPNPFGMMKLVFGGRALILQEVMPSELAFAPSEPGTVLSTGPEGWLVACGIGSLRIKRMGTLCGETIACDAAAAYLGVSSGAVLAAVRPHPGREALNHSISRAESHWALELSQRVLPVLPHGVQSERVAAEVSLSLAWPAALSGREVDAGVALIGLLLSCIARQDQFDLALVESPIAPFVTESVGALLSRAKPFRIDVDPTTGFETLVRQIQARRRILTENPGFLVDLIARQPALKHFDDLVSGALSPVAVVVSDRQVGPAELPKGAALALVVRPDQTCSLATDGQLTAAALQALARQMMVVAQKVVLEPTLPLRQIELLDDTQRARQISHWNDTAAPFPDHLRIHDLFDAQALRQPDAVALVFEGSQMTFGALEKRANQVANALQARGAGPGDYVAVLVERGFDLIVALLGVAKSGAAYLPIDPVYPQDRMRFMLKDAGVKTVVVSKDLVLQLEPDASGQLVMGSLDLIGASDERPTSAANSSDVCYTIYTSGSTGLPKGVVLTHRAVVNTLHWVNRTLEVGPKDRLLFVTSPSFDLSVYDIFGALGAGAAVEVASEDLLREPARLAHHVATQGITIWDSAPPALARLADFFPAQSSSATKTPASALRLVMLSGDWIPVWLPTRLMQVFPGVKVRSLGGATEAAIWSNHFPVEAVDPAWASIPYGNPIQNARYYILDNHQRPMPPQMPGDLYIAGECLAQGYLNREELTAERFVPDPFHAGQRMYKTGDLARYWADGTMEFLGRADFQVKIRGYRVEMGEVEAAIRALPNIRDVVCTTWVDGSNQQSLVAYVVPTACQAVDAAQIKTSLSSRLPDFMVPSWVIPLEALPITSNGKLDRKALPSPAQAQVGSAYEAPVTDLQRALVKVWEEVLKRAPIGINDNFFDIGGHSLLAVSLVTKLKSTLQVTVPLSRIIEQPTIERFAAALGHAASPVRNLEDGLIELKKGAEATLFMVHDGEGETLLYRSLALRLPEEFSVVGIPPHALPGIPMAHCGVPEMAEAYLVGVRARQPVGPYYLGGLCAGGVIAFEMAVQLERAGERVELVAILDAVEPLTKPKSFVTSRRRIQRFKDVFKANRAQGSNQKLGALGMLRVGAVAVRKSTNVLRYEVVSRLDSLFIDARLWLLRKLLEQGKGWPSVIPPLPVRHIYLAAKAAYVPDTLAQARVVVMKAAEGAEADEPAFYQIDDPMLGWGRVVRGRLEAVDVRGGHSSMLQMPHVDKLAEQISALLTETRASATTS
jgi:amino acid adenylation domain-containing protein